MGILDGIRNLIEGRRQKKETEIYNKELDAKMDGILENYKDKSSKSYIQDVIDTVSPKYSGELEIQKWYSDEDDSVENRARGNYMQELVLEYSIYNLEIIYRYFNEDTYTIGIKYNGKEYGIYFSQDIGRDTSPVKFHLEVELESKTRSKVKFGGGMRYKNIEDYLRNTLDGVLDYLSDIFKTVEEFRQELESHRIVEDGLLKGVRGGVMLLGGKGNRLTYISKMGMYTTGLKIGEDGLVEKLFKLDDGEVYYGKEVINKSVRFHYDLNSKFTEDVEGTIVLDKEVSLGVKEGLDELYNILTKKIKEKHSAINYKENPDGRDKERIGRLLQQLTKRKINYNLKEGKVSAVYVRLGDNNLLVTPNLIVNSEGFLIYDRNRPSNTPDEYGFLGQYLVSNVRTQDDADKVKLFVESYGIACDLRRKLG